VHCLLPTGDRMLHVNMPLPRRPGVRSLDNLHPPSLLVVDAQLLVSTAAKPPTRLASPLQTLMMQTKVSFVMSHTLSPLMRPSPLHTLAVPSPVPNPSSLAISPLLGIPASSCLQLSWCSPPSLPSWPTSSPTHIASGNATLPLQRAQVCP
jgi:hypothetical protein